MEINKLNSLVELYFNKCNETDNDKPFLKWLKPGKPTYSWGDIKERIFKLSHKIKSLIKEGDRCLILSENRPYWLMSDIAVMNAGGISVPIFTTYSANDYKYILNDCNPSLIIVSNNDQFKKIKDYINLQEQKVISFEEVETGSLLIKDILDETSYEKKINQSLKRNMPACIIYTSGTSGNPKGVVLSHGGILSNCESAVELLEPLTKIKDPIFLTWLPLSHSYEHTVQFIQIIVGAKVFYAESLEKLISNMSIARPTIMTAVPRFYQNLFIKINMNLEKQTGLKKKLIDKTLELGKKLLKKEKFLASEKIVNFICNILVRKKIQNQFGGNLQAFVSGGGALDQKIGEFLNSIGLPTLQGYGLTEASPVVSCNLPGLVKVDTVGTPFRTNKVKIAKDGEILVKGENVMLGYWNNKEATNKVIKNEWLHTGDIGEIDLNGFLKITDRKKDIIVNLGGDNIAPSKIENILCLNEFIKQSFVYGDKKNYLVALLVVEKDINKENIKIILENINKNLSLIEKIKKFYLINEEFTINNGMLTPTLKLKRKEIINNYKQQLENLY
ncbi:long-chain fatty acid--CoA ligase [Pelagibacteraceae bacterium]|nr:long-chain fatty acid--CoA ligase [Pelagibacteraceae bacterium]MDC0339482.1 long-chain fatty acid--CoA ligase [Pelagibacteraceae bacterium]MDC0366150.1 long-chain fatty acid--CoA ligase [Pelagibacteraceae bacterium]